MADPHRVSGLILLSLIFVLGLLPPETRGESMAGTAALVTLLVVLSWKRVAPGAGPAALGLLLVLAWPLTVAAAAPGAAVLPIAFAVLAVTLGVHAAPLSESLGRKPALPWTLTAAGGMVGLYALAQWLWLLEARAERLATLPGVPDRELVLVRLEQGRAFEPFATPAALGGFLAIILPVTLVLAIGRQGRARGVLFGVAAIETAGLLATESVTAVGALLVAGGAAVMLHTSMRRHVIVTAVFAAALLAAVVALRGGGVTDLSRWDHPWRLRAGNFRVALDVIRDNPVTGVGPGGFGEVFPAYRLPDDNETQHVHNLPLELGAELGVVAGALVTVAFFWLFVGPLFRRAEDPAWRRGLAVGLAAFAIQNLADFTAFFPSLLWLAAMLRGLLARPAFAVGLSPRLAFLRVTTLTASVAAAVIVTLGGLAWNAKYGARVAAAANDPAATAEHAERAVRLAPWDIDARLALSQAILAARDPSAPSDVATSELLAHAGRAVELSPVRPSARAVRARARLATGDAPGAHADLLQAARLYPANVEYRQAAESLEKRLPGRGATEPR